MQSALNRRATSDAFACATHSATTHSPKSPPNRMLVFYVPERALFLCDIVISQHRCAMAHAAEAARREEAREAIERAAQIHRELRCA